MSSGELRRARFISWSSKLFSCSKAKIWLLECSEQFHTKPTALYCHITAHQPLLCKTCTNPSNLSCNNANLFQAVFCWAVQENNVPHKQTFIDTSLVEDAGRNQKHLHSGLYLSKQCLTRENGHSQLVPLPFCGLPEDWILLCFWTWMYLVAYLAQADGVVKRLGPGVEMYSLLDFILTLVLAGQVIWCCPIPRFICYFSSLKRKSYSFTLCPYSSQEWEFYGSRWEEAALPSECCPESSGCGLGKNNPEPVHSILVQIPYLLGSPDTVPTISTGS